MDLDSIYVRFPLNRDCIAYLETLRWGDKPMCPYCKRKNSTKTRNDDRHHCNVCNVSFSVTVGTLFHRTRIPLQKWFLSIGLMMSVQKDPTVRELAQLLAVDKNTASLLVRRIKIARVKDFSFLRVLADRLAEE